MFAACALPDITALPVVDPSGAASLNQTYGWGCESGDAYGSGTSFDGEQFLAPWCFLAQGTNCCEL